MKCRICNTNEANQTGAHIFPAWMIASAFDFESRNRDFEIVFDMQLFGDKLPYFGRRVPVDKVEELIGRAITDEEGEKNSNCLTVNNIWCRDCEKRIKISEDYFLENIDRNLPGFSQLNEIDKFNYPRANKYLVRLFVYTLIYRAYISNKFNIYLSNKTEKKIKLFLNKYLKNTLEETLETIENCSNKEQLLKFPFRLIKVEEESPSKSFLFVHRFYDRPYLLIINDYILQFYGKGSCFHFKDEGFFGIYGLIKESLNIRNYNETIFTIGVIKVKTWKGIRTKFYEQKGDEWIKENRCLFRKVYRLEHGIFPTEEKVKQFLIDVTNKELPLQVKYSKDKVMEAIKRNI